MDPATTGNELLNQVRNGKNARARTQTTLRGLLKGAQTAHKAGPEQFQEWVTAQTGMIDAYCDAIEGTQQGAATGATGTR